jgi:hypothetical protein
MAHYVLTHLRLVPDVDWAALESRLEGLAEVVAGEEAFESLRLLKTSNVQGLLVTRYHDADIGQRVASEVADPWIGEHLAKFLAEPPASNGGELRLEVKRTEDAALIEVEGREPRERLDYFVQTLVEERALWGLYGETWARSPNEEGVEALPFWPRMEFAARCIRDHWSAFAPREIKLEGFLEQWLTGMEEDGIPAVVFPTPSHPGLVVAPGELLAALHARLSIGS